MLSVGGPTEGMIAKAQQGRLIVVGHEPDIATATTVTAIGTALGYVGFATE